MLQQLKRKLASLLTAFFSQTAGTTCVALEIFIRPYSRLDYLSVRLTDHLLGYRFFPCFLNKIAATNLFNTDSKRIKSWGIKIIINNFECTGCPTIDSHIGKKVLFVRLQRNRAREHDPIFWENRWPCGFWIFLFNLFLRYLHIT